MDPALHLRPVTVVTLTLCCLVLTLLAGCGRRADAGADYHRINLPGFSVEVPETIVVSTSNSPSTGKHTLKFPEPGLLEKTFEEAHGAGKLLLEWDSQAYSREDWKKLLLPTFVQSFAAHVPGGSRILREAEPAKDRWVYVLGQDRAPVGIGVINCDSSFSVTVTFARHRDVDRTAEELTRIVKSVQCAVAEANRARPVAAIRLPQKFGRTPDRDVQIYQSLDGEQFIVNFTQSDVQREPKLYRTIIRTLLANAMGLEIAESQLRELPDGAPRPAGKNTLMRLDLPATQESLYVGTIYCPAVELSLISIWYAPEASDQLARERHSQSGCPGEESTSTVDFEVIADAACKAGNTRFCGQKQMPE
jgi:hypothetical protein